MALNTEKYINVYYNKGDRKPYDVNGKPIAYLGTDYVGANEATIIRFNIGDDTGVVEGVADVKRPDGEKAFLIMSKVTIGTDVFYELPLTDWHTAKVGKLVISFKAFDGNITVVDGVIQANNLRVIVSDIFNVDIGYSPNSTEEAPPFDPNDLSAIIASLSTKLDKANGINVVQALPTPIDNSLNGRWYLVKSGSPESVGKLYVFNNATAVEVELGTSQFNFSTTGLPTDALTVGQVRYNDTTGSLDLGLKGNHILKVGETVVKRVRNDEAVSLKVGQMVYVSGSVGNSGLLLIKKASNLGEATSSKTFGMVATAMNTTSTKDGYVYIYGLLQGIDLTDTDISESVFSSGDVGAGLWLGENGKITKTLPTADNKHSVFIGYLDTYGGAGSNCSIYVKIQNGYELSELHDVRVSAIADNQILRYNSTRQVWENTNELTTAESNIANLQGRMTTEEANVDNLQGRMTTAETDITNIENGTTIVGKALADQNGNVINTTYLTQSSASATYIPLSQKGANNGVVPLNSNGKISSIYLSGEQDDYIEFANLASFPLVGEADIIYCAIDTGLIYRWTGSTYAVISPSLALGTTATTAYAGDKGLALEGIVNTANQVDTGIVKWNATTGRFESSNTLVQTNGGNVGVGTTSPTATLHIASPTTATYNRVIKLGTGSLTDTNGTYIEFPSSIGDGTGSRIGGGREGSNGSSFIRFDTVNTSSSIVERMRILANGRVGIGTTAPDQLLHVAGQINLHSQITWFNGNADINGADTNLKFRTYNGTALTEYMRLTSAGRLGIGTTAPNATLNINQSADGFEEGFSVTRTGANRGNLFLNASDNTFNIARGSNTPAISINASLNVGIGTASPGTRLDVNGSTTLGSSTFGVGHTVTINSSTGGIGWLDVVNSASVAGALGRGNGIRFSSASGNIGSIRVETIDANNSGKLFFNTVNAGTDTTKMTILPNGNVGIGTSSPVTTLSLVTTANTDGLQIRRDSTTANDYARLAFLVSTANQNGSTAEIRALRTNRAVSNDTDLRFATNSNGTLTERMTIRDDGNVGIGTTAPATKLHVAGGTRITGVVSVMNDTEVKRVLIDYDDALDVGIITAIQDGVSYKNLVLNRDGANVGIGTTFPTATLQVKSDSTTKVPLIVDTVASHATLLQEWRVNGTANSRITSTGYFSGLGLLNFSDSNNGSVVMLNAGTKIERNIADTNPALIVNLANASATGNIQVWQKAGTAQAYVSNNGYYYGIGIVNISSSANSTIDTGTTGTLISRNVNDANVVLKVRQFNASATGRLQEWIAGSTVLAYTDIAGEFYNFTGTYGTISDLRVKENIIDARDYTEDLMKLRVVKYSLKKDQEQEATKLGFIAQEVEQVFPNMVQTTETEEIKDLKSIKMSVLIPMLVKTIQELNKRIEELEKK